MKKTLLITGASRGIGKAIIEKFASQNFNIAFCSLQEKNVQSLIAELKNKYPDLAILGKAVDMSKRESVKAFGHEVLNAFQHVDLLINNAGLFQPGMVHNEEEGQLEKMIETNLYSAYYMTRAVVEKMKEQKSGTIINICSIAGLKAYPNGGSYSISKFAMQGLSKALREELKEYQIAVTTVYPGATLTDAWAGVDLPEDRFIDVQDIAASVYDIYQLSKRTVIEDIVIRPMLGDI